MFPIRGSIFVCYPYTYHVLCLNHFCTRVRCYYTTNVKQVTT